MSHFIIALAIAEAVSFIVIGIVASGKALAAFGLTALLWCSAWLAAVVIFAYISANNGLVTWAPLISVSLAIANGLVTYAAYRVMDKFELKLASCSA